ncbi:uncharacterized protein LOC126749338 [Anthonomus grandis grandis]|uniref:uncharacterized protein LOC126749338 n=1 Tax=Anthonomus grandis grandis TaxID=2921223 RepID=UPI002165DFBA|nr:uncharacterized protein LOC126749338 [Anthonomus grandis grandis]
MSQIRVQKQKPKARRYTLSEKVLALTILKASGRGYRLLSKIFTLPSKKTLTELLRQIPFPCGINKALFESLRESVNKMPPQDRMAILVFDEMAIDSLVQYNIGENQIEGIHDLGNEHRKPEIADYANVFMLKGVFKQWKQPICYTFSAGPTRSIAIKQLIVEMIKECQQINLEIVATVCDQGSGNSAAINMLLEETKKMFLKKQEENQNIGFIVNNQEVIPLFDTPHLMKGLRNNLLTKDLNFEMNNKKCVAKWRHYEQLYLIDSENPNEKVFPKLTDQHIMPNKINKMKVKCCTQLFSHQVGAKIWLESCNRMDLLPKIADLYKNYKICEQHFEKKYINQGNERKCLLNNAVPTLFPTLKRKVVEEEDNIPPFKPPSNLTLPQMTLQQPLLEPSFDVATDINMASSSLIAPMMMTSQPSLKPSCVTSDPNTSKDRFKNSPPSEEKTLKNLISPTSCTQTEEALSRNTPRKKKLRLKINHIRRKNRKLSFKKEASTTKNWSLEDFNNMCDHFLSRTVSQIVKTHAALKDKKPLARRYTPELKEFALRLYFLSPSGYRFLSKIFTLPTKRSLQKMTKTISCNPGLNNDSIYKSLKIKVNTMLQQDRHCIICIDEMSIKSQLCFDTGYDKIIGFEDLGFEGTEGVICENVLVIMARSSSSSEKVGKLVIHQKT